MAGHQGQLRHADLPEIQAVHRTAFRRSLRHRVLLGGAAGAANSGMIRAERMIDYSTIYHKVRMRFLA